MTIDTSIYDIAKHMAAKGKGILAADESTGTADKRFAALGVSQTEEMRRQWRQLLLTTPGIEEFLNGVILFDETIRQQTDQGVGFAKLLQGKGVIPGIKVDQGTVDYDGHPGEKITQGLDGLAGRLQEYYAMGTRFTKWRAVITIGESIPSQECIQKNAEILAEYARVSQEQGFVPIIEPEVLLEGDHTIEKAEEVTTNTLKTVFVEVQKAGVDLQSLILKSSMVLAGKDCAEQANSQQIAEATIRTFQNSVPKDVAGIVFLSGGQSPQQATENLNEIIKLGPQQWPLTFSFSRALQEPVLDLWRGNPANVPTAQQAFLKRLRLNYTALSGDYTPDME
ncbi:MAG TPA: class I fructose-bisphosphate aldolase [Candidatus Paceibacterota bacterium]|nr:class I fructose-bisphosphate aldolase [Candidatus Paceibacterota bacterium]